MKIQLFGKRVFEFAILLLLLGFNVGCEAINSDKDKIDILQNSFGEIGLAPEIFAPGFISTELHYEFAGTFTPDYKQFFFTRRPINGTNRIYYTEYINGEWSEPSISSINLDVDEFEPYITPDGNTIYFGSKRNNESEYAFYQSELLNGTWQTPTYSENGLNQGFSMYVSVSNSGNIYFTGTGSIYVIEYIDGVYQPKTTTGIRGVHPYIAPDESYMLFDRDSGNSSFIYITFNDNGVWSIPIMLGEEVNQTGAEQICSSVTSDGKYMFFSRFVDGESNIFWVSATYLDQYKLD